MKKQKSNQGRASNSPPLSVYRITTEAESKEIMEHISPEQEVAIKLQSPNIPDVSTFDERTVKDYEPSAFEEEGMV